MLPPPIHGVCSEGSIPVSTGSREEQSVILLICGRAVTRGKQNLEHRAGLALLDRHSCCGRDTQSSFELEKGKYLRPLGRGAVGERDRERSTWSDAELSRDTPGSPVPSLLES